MKKEVKQISLAEYAKLLKISKQGAHKKLKKGDNPGVKSYKYIGSTIVIDFYTKYEEILNKS